MHLRVHVRRSRSLGMMRAHARPVSADENQP